MTTSSPIPAWWVHQQSPFPSHARSAPIALGASLSHSHIYSHSHNHSHSHSHSHNHHAGLGLSRSYILPTATTPQSAVRLTPQLSYVQPPTNPSVRSVATLPVPRAYAPHSGVPLQPSAVSVPTARTEAVQTPFVHSVPSVPSVPSVLSTPVRHVPVASPERPVSGTQRSITPFASPSIRPPQASPAALEPTPSTRPLTASESIFRQASYFHSPSHRTNTIRPSSTIRSVSAGRDRRGNAGIVVVHSLPQQSTLRNPTFSLPRNGYGRLDASPFQPHA